MGFSAKKMFRVLFETSPELVTTRKVSFFLKIAQNIYIFKQFNLFHLNFEIVNQNGNARNDFSRIQEFVICLILTINKEIDNF